MTALYIASSEKGSGKTALCAGLGKLLLSKGKKVGFFKPVVAGADGDAQFMKQLLALPEAVEALSPVIRNGNIKEAYDKVAQGKDVVIIEGTPLSRDIVTALNAKVLIMEAYSREPLKASDNYKAFGQALLGVIVNKVPKNRLEQAGKLSKAGVTILGALPEDRTLMAMTIGELAQSIQGEIIPATSRSDELVENLMLGAMGLDPGPMYFGRKVNKAVVLKSERPDMAMAALETPTRCLVLAGNTPPKQTVLNQAVAKKVPVILAKDSVLTLTEKIEDALVKTRFSQAQKVPRLTELIEKNLDLKKIYQGLGV